MSVEQGLLSDICERPEDDVPRLVYADWLEDHDQPDRAELIRVQLELARLPQAHARHAELQRRERELLAAHEKQWLGPLARMISSYQYRGGFVEQVRIGVRQFMDNADEAFRLAPLCHVKLLRLTQSKIPLAEVADCPHLARLRGLDLNGSELGDPALTVLLASPHLTNLGVLHLARSQVGGGALGALLKANLPALKVLDLSGNSLSLGVQELKKAPSFRLEVLDLSDTGIRARDIGPLFAWKGLTGLRELRLRNNYLGVAGGEGLARSPHLKGLTTLDLSGCNIGGGGMQALAGSKNLANLTSLVLAGNSIGRIGVQALTASRCLRKLRGLFLATNNLRDRGVQFLADWPGLVNHAQLILEGNDITDEGARALIRSPHLGELTDLDLGLNPITDETAKVLADCPRLTSLTDLRLWGCHLGNEGAQALLGAPYLKQLKRLGITSRLFSRTIQGALRKRFGL